jgi:hypothetical protein
MYRHCQAEDIETASGMSCRVRRHVGGRVQPDGGDAGHNTPDEIVGLVLGT